MGRLRTSRYHAACAPYVPHALKCPMPPMQAQLRSSGAEASQPSALQTYAHALAASAGNTSKSCSVFAEAAFLYRNTYCSPYFCQMIY